MKKRLFILWVLLGLSLSSGNSWAKIYIDIDSPNFQLYPIAVADFQSADLSSVKAADYGAALADEIKKYLVMTGFFSALDRKSFLEDKATVTSPERNINFADWSMIGADYLVRGRFALRDRELSVECWLFDVIRGELVFNKKYAAVDGNRVSVIRNIAADILFALTGSEGDFNTQIAFIIQKAGGTDIRTISYDGSDQKTITSHKSIILSPRWSPNGNFLAFTSFNDGRPEVYIKDLSTGSERKVASFDGLNLSGYWSPDGKRILLTLSKDGNEEIYDLEINTKKLKRLTTNYSIDVSPSWSPDGKKIVFVSDRGGSPQIYTMDADGTNVKRISFEGNYNTSPSWSPRGDRIAYEGRINGRFQIFTIDPEGNNLLQLTFDDADNESPSWSPSGRQIVYRSKTASKGRICIMNANGLNARIIVEADRSLSMPMWSPRTK